MFLGVPVPHGLDVFPEVPVPHGPDQPQAIAEPPAVLRKSTRSMKIPDYYGITRKKN